MDQTIYTIISRQEAKAQGLTQYFTGEPCNRGHLSPRNIGSYNCLECWREYAQTSRTDNPQKHKLIRANEYKRNKESILAQQAEYRTLNWDTIYQKRKNDVKYQQYMAEYFKDYFKREVPRAKSLANCRKRQAAKLCATPKWANFELIQEFYIESARISADTGIPHQVDHIIPLRGELVCGLHVETNLRVITRKQNRDKWNKLDHSLLG